MTCRQIVKHTVDGKERWDVVFFGKIDDSTDKYDNYVADTEAVISGLVQRLNIIEGEIWYNRDFGMPLPDNIGSKTELDIHVQRVITSHPGVRCIVSFTSAIDKHEYSFSATVESVFGDTFTIGKN